MQNEQNAGVVSSNLACVVQDLRPSWKWPILQPLSLIHGDSRRVCGRTPHLGQGTTLSGGQLC